VQNIFALGDNTHSVGDFVCEPNIKIETEPVNDLISDLIKTQTFIPLCNQLLKGVVHKFIGFS